MLETVEGGADSLAARSRLKADRELYRSLMHGLASQLDSLYRSDVSRADKLLLKSEVIDELRQSAEEAPWLTGRYVDPESWTINNATLGLFRTYNQSSDIFDRVLKRSGDLKSALQVFDRCEGEQDPHGVLERWLEENTTPK
jgi:predicted aminopeptidase